MMGDMDNGTGTQTPGSAMTQAMEIQKLQADIKALVKDNARLKKENDFLVNIPVRQCMLSGEAVHSFRKIVHCFPYKMHYNSNCSCKPYLDQSL